MKKLKLFIFALLSVLTLGLFVVTGSKVEAASTNYSFSYAAIKNESGTAAPSDKAPLSQAMLGEVNSFLIIKNGETANSNVTYRTSNSCIELKHDNLSVVFSGFGTLSVTVTSTGGSNTSNFGVKDSTGTFLTSSGSLSGVTLLENPDEDGGNYQFSGTTNRTFTYDIPSAGIYTLSSYWSNGSSERGCRVKNVEMTDNVGTSYKVTYMDGATKLHEVSVLDGSTPSEYKPEKNGSYVLWHALSDLSDEAVDPTTISINKDTVYYAEFVEYDTYLDSRNIVNNNYSSSVTKETVDKFSNTIFNFVTMGVATDSGKTMPYGGNNSYRLVTNSAGSATKNSINFVAPYDCTLTLLTATGDVNRVGYVFEDSYDTANAILTITSEEKNTLTVSEVNIKAGKTYYIGSSNSIYIYGIYLGSSKLVSATTTAFQNVDKDSLRIVGTLSGVTNTANIKSIELVLLKDGVATKNQIFLTNVYTSITGVDGFAEKDYTYYVVFKITGISSSDMPDNTEISHKLKVTFTDDSFVESTANVSTWNN